MLVWGTFYRALHEADECRVEYARGVGNARSGHEASGRRGMGQTSAYIEVYHLQARQQSRQLLCRPC